MHASYRLASIWLALVVASCAFVLVLWQPALAGSLLFLPLVGMPRYARM